MRKLKAQTKLHLAIETIRELSRVELTRAAGGAGKSVYQQQCSYDEDTRYTFYFTCTVDSYAVGCDG